MHRFLTLLILATLALTGCGTSPMDVESTREVVLQYLGGNVGTAGPFGRGGKKELAVLSNADRQRAEAQIDNGAAAFLVFGTDPGAVNQASHVTRVVMVQRNKIVGDYRATNPAAEAGGGAGH